MKIPEGVRVCCAADLFEYDEAKALNLRKFFSYYKDQFPMLIVIIGGHYGETKFDCYDNLQVLRVHCYSSQPRVAAEDARLDPRCQTGCITIPEDTLIKFRLVKGHTKVGLPQRLSELLQENDQLPLLVQMACDRQYPVRVGTNRHVAKDFGNIMIKEKYSEHFFMMNCVDGVELNLNKLICMACLSEDLEATPVTGFKYGSKAEFDELCRNLSREVAESGEVYDRTQGNDDFSEYSFDEMRNLLEMSDSVTGTWLRDKDDIDAADTQDDDYEEIPPDLPSRKPVQAPVTNEAKANIHQDKKQHYKPAPIPATKPSAQSPKHPKSPKVQHKDKDSKGAFGFLKKRHRDHHSTEEEEGKQLKDAVNPVKSPNTADDTHLHTNRAPPKIPPKAVSFPATQTSESQDTNAYSSAGYVKLAAHNNYQNTKIGRATVKPMQQVNVDTQREDNLPIKADDKEEQEYEVPDDVSTAQSVNKSAVERKQNQNKRNPLLNELQKKITAHDNKASDSTEEVYDEEYEDMDLGKGTKQGNGDNVVPRQQVPQSKVTHSDRQHSPRGKHHPDISREENVPSNTEGQIAKDVPEFNVNEMSIKEIGENLKALKLGQYAEVFEENQVDGEILASLSVEDLQNELGLKKLEAIRLNKFAISGHVPR
ncbi:uncharacterized protein LOC123539940 [Mercenaria mercenaria]|uniref:uncharacterized protein LOC123539940 n=1 Tax=Mercenaria mercenaria TaxID=6596 RepID=UPI00234E724F|nr:uncharacterized protein LOC123539940 [Mercenaria mercenaria]